MTGQWVIRQNRYTYTFVQNFKFDVSRGKCRKRVIVFFAGLTALVTNHSLSSQHSSLAALVLLSPFTLPRRARDSRHVTGEFHITGGHHTVTLQPRHTIHQGPHPARSERPGGAASRVTTPDLPARRRDGGGPACRADCAP